MSKTHSQTDRFSVEINVTYSGTVITKSTVQAQITITAKSGTDSGEWFVCMVVANSYLKMFSSY